MAYLTPISLKRPRSASWSSYTTPRQVAKKLFTQAAAYSAKRVGSYVASKIAGGPKSGVATTTQHDVSRQYRYKRMPRRKRRRWVKALKKNDAMDMSQSATQTVIYNTVLEGQLDFLANSRTQNWIACHLYGMNGSAPTPINFAQEVGVEDLKAIRNLDKRVKNQANTRLKFESGIMDLTIKNPNTANGLEVDVYEVVYRTSTKQTSMMALHQSLVGQTPSNQDPPSANDRAAWDVRGITPFDTVQFGASGAKILTKKKVFLPPGNTFTYQYRDPKNHYFGPDDFTDTTGFVGKSTRTILFVWKSITGEPISGSNPRLFVGVSRIYKYKVKGEVESGLIIG